MCPPHAPCGLSRAMLQLSTSRTLHTPRFGIIQNLYICNIARSRQSVLNMSLTSAVQCSCVHRSGMHKLTECTALTLSCAVATLFHVVLWPQWAVAERLPSDVHGGCSGTCRRRSAAQRQRSGVCCGRHHRQVSPMRAHPAVKLPDSP